MPVSGAWTYTLDGSNATITDYDSGFTAPIGTGVANIPNDTSYLSISNHSDFDLSSDDFTIECYLNTSETLSTTQKGIVSKAVSGNYGWALSIRNNDIIFQYSTDGSTSTTLTFVVPYFIKHKTCHIAIVRNGSQLKAYVDGVASSSIRDMGTDTIYTSTTDVHIGRYYNSTTYNFNGYLDEIRVSKGIARYTTNFTPPTIAFINDANTSLLLHCDGTEGSTTFTDSSSTGHTVIANGSADIHANYINGGFTPTIPTTLDGYAVVAISDYAMYNKYLTSVTFNHSVELGYLCCSYNIGLSVTINASLTLKSSTSATNAPFLYCEIGSNLTLDSSITVIPSFLFANSGLTSITLHSGLVEIGEESFYGCDIETLDFPSTLTTIGDRAFFYNDGITSITLPSTLTSVGIYAFYYCRYVTSITLESGFNALSVGCFNNCGDATSLEHVTIPSGITLIPEQCFYSSTLTSVTLPEGLTQIDYEAFGDTELTEVIFPSTMLTINERAFVSCKLTSITLNDGLEYIGDSAFNQNLIAGELVLPESLTYLGEYAFINNKITSFNWLDIMADVPDGLFDINELTSVTIPDFVTNIGYSAFEQNNISEINWPSGNLTIESYAFYGNHELLSVTIPETVTSIGYSAFGWCINLADFYVYNDDVVYSGKVLDQNMSTENKGTVYANDPSTTKTMWETYHTSTYDFAPLPTPPPQAISRVVITPEYGFQIDRWNQYLNGGEGDWGNVVYIGTDGQFHIDNGYLDMRKIVTNCAEDLVEQNRILIDPAIGFKIQKNLDIQTVPETPNWFDVFYVDTEGDVKLADENGNGIILDQFGMDTKFIKWFKNMCWNSSFEIFDETTLTPTYWEGDGISSADSSWFGDYSCRLAANGDYIQQTDTSATNPNFYDNVVPDTNLTRISFHKKRGACKVEVFDVDNADAAYTLTDTDGNSGTSLTFDRNENYIPESYSFNFDHFEHGPTTKFRLKFTNVDVEPVAEDAYVFLDAIIIEPDYTQRRPSFYTDGIKSQSITTIGDIGAQIVVGTTPPSDTTKLWLDTN